MLRIPVILLTGFMGALGILLGVHGLYVYFKYPSAFWGSGIDKLFLHFTVPMRLRGAIEWASMEGAQSLFMPALILIVGIVFWKWSNVSDLIVSWLRRWKLW